MRNLIASVVLVLPILLMGCNNTVGPDPDREPPRALTAVEAQVVDADNQFGLDVFRALSRDDADENVFISPLSLSYALGMALNGARGETREAMLEAMRLQGLSEAEINASYRAVMDMLRTLDPRVAFALANSIWYREGFSPNAEFLEKGEHYFDAKIESLDFSSPGAKDVINAWIEDATEGMIEEMIDSIDPDVMMYLINAIYFKGDWRYQFDPEETREEAFRTGDGREVQVPMMRQRVTLPYSARDGYQVVDVPYGDSLFTMTIILPAEGEDVNEVIDDLDDQAWRNLTAELRPQEIDLHMPRFELEYEVELNDVLSDLGMDIAFSRQADFSGISEGLYISMVKQKAVVDVNEEGTEAAAATVVEIRVTSAPATPLVRLDRPFVFVIRDLHTGTILFIGKAMDVS